MVEKLGVLKAYKYTTSDGVVHVRLGRADNDSGVNFVRWGDLVMQPQDWESFSNTLIFGDRIPILPASLQDLDEPFMQKN